MMDDMVYGLSREETYIVSDAFRECNHFTTGDAQFADLAIVGIEAPVPCSGVFGVCIWGCLEVFRGVYMVNTHV